MTTVGMQFRKIPHSMTFGVEIECYPDNPRRDYAEPSTYLGFFYCTIDGSLSYERGREYVSQPMPYDMLVRHIKWLYKRINWTTDRKCGLHVHVNRSMWTPQREMEFSQFLATRFTSADAEKYFGRFSENFAHMRNSPISKYRAVNLLHKATYEFRVWRAGDLEWTLEALRRTRAIVQHHGPWSMEVMDKICGTKSEVSSGPLIDPSWVRNFSVQATSTYGQMAERIAGHALEGSIGDDFVITGTRLDLINRVNAQRIRRGTPLIDPLTGIDPTL